MLAIFKKFPIDSLNFKSQTKIHMYNYLLNNILSFH